jgi:hypothetical protein
VREPRKRRTVFSIAFFDSRRQNFWLSDSPNREELSTRKLNAGVFAQPRWSEDDIRRESEFLFRCYSDPDVVRYASDGDLVLVTNNASDFRQLYAAQPLHAGLVILIPAVNRMVQQKLFRAALDELALIGEPVNRVLEVDLDGRGGDAHALPSALSRFLANAPAMFLILYYSMKHAYLLFSKYGH